MLAFRRGLILYLGEWRLAMPLERMWNQTRAVFYNHQIQRNMKRKILVFTFAAISMAAMAQSEEIASIDSLCQHIDTCNYDIVRKDSCQQQHRLSFVRKEQRQTWSISPNAVKMQKFDPYRKKFTDMRIMETIGSHISR